MGGGVGCCEGVRPSEGVLEVGCTLYYLTLVIGRAMKRPVAAVTIGVARA